jgi:hypothetical protein
MQSLVNSPGGGLDTMRMVGGGAGADGMPQDDLDGMSYEQLLQRFGDGSENREADEGTIRSLPVSAVPDPEKLPEDCRTCAICLEAFEAGGMRKTSRVCTDSTKRALTSGCGPMGRAPFANITLVVS